MLLDLPTHEMQKVTNVIFAGLVSGPVNPSTAVWNKIVPHLWNDMERRCPVVRGVKMSVSIVTVSADQPAKRSLFGFAACNSESSCFYGLCSGTLHKKQGKGKQDLEI